MATRDNYIARRGAQIVIVIDHIECRLSESAFIELMAGAGSLLAALLTEQEQRRAALRQSEPSAPAVGAPANRHRRPSPFRGRCVSAPRTRNRKDQ